MKFTKLCLLFITMVSLNLAAKAQTADDIISKYTAAIGGKDKLGQIKTMQTEAIVNVMGSDNPASSTLLVGKGYLTQADINGQKAVQCYTDKGGWNINPFAGATTAAPMPDDQYETGRDGLWIGGALLNYAANGYKAELLAKDGNSYPIKVTGGKFETTYFIDATTYLPTKMLSKALMQGQMLNVTTTLSNYQKTDFGLLAAYKIDIDLGQFQLSYTLKSVTINKEVDPKIFDMPGK